MGRILDSEIDEPALKRHKPALDLGYSSSEEEDESNGEEPTVEEEEEEEVQDQLEEEQAVDLSDLDDLLASEEESELIQLTSEQLMFNSILDSLDLDVYSSFDLEFDKISQSVVFQECKMLPQSEMESLFEKHLHNKIKNGLDTVTLTVSSPIELFTEFLVNFDGKFPKSFTDFNRRQRNNETYKNLELDMKTKSLIYNRWIKFKDLSEGERTILINKLQTQNSSNEIPQERLVESIELLFK